MSCIIGIFFPFFSIVLGQKPIGNIYDNLLLFIILVIISLVQKTVIYGFELRTTVQHLSVNCCQGIKEVRNINKTYIFNLCEVYFWLVC